MDRPSSASELSSSVGLTLCIFLWMFFHPDDQKSVWGFNRSLKNNDQKIITAESGQDVTLTCRAPNNNIIVVEWSRADLGDEHVLLYRDGHFVPDNQHPSFKNRVDLQDRQMKDGDVSLILKDVTINDTGTYVCRVFMRETRSWKLIIIIHLHVDPPGQTAPSVGLIICVSAAAAAAAAAAVFFYKRKHSKRDSTTVNDPEVGQPLSTTPPNSDLDDLKMN